MTTDDRTRAIAWFEKQAKCLAMPGAAKMFGLAAEALKEGRWIPVSERLPEKFGKYLTCDEKGNIHIFTHNPIAPYPFMIAPNSEQYYQPTHWMPLPDLPRKDDEA